MANDWLSKAKAAAQNIAKDATEAAKNANLGEMMNKGKAMAMHATEEAKKAADSMMAKKEGAAAAPAATTQAAAPAPAKVDPAFGECNSRLASIESLMAEVKALPATVSSEDIVGRLAKVEALLAEIKGLLNK
jgi:hypothetical protein